MRILARTLSYPPVKMCNMQKIMQLSVHYGHKCGTIFYLEITMHETQE